jgi:localization factor PodJL
MFDRMVGSETSIDRNVDALQGEVAALRRDLAKLGSATRNPALEEQVRRLSERLEVAGSQNPDPHVLAKIEEKVVRLGELIITDARKPTETAAIEAKLAKLETLLSDRHEDALAAANVAAREAVREFANFAADARESDTGVRQLAEHLRDLQEASRTTEARTSDALQSVHDALTTIVSRLGAIERAPDHRTAAEQPAAERSYGQQATPARQPLPEAPTLETRQRADERTAPIPQQATRPEQPISNPEDHRPLEPGSGKPRVPTSQPGPFAGNSPAGSPGVRAQPAPRAAQAPGHAGQPAAPEAEGGPKRNDFIAAARRAAQAASQASPGAPPIPGERVRHDAYADFGSEAPT